MQTMGKQQRGSVDLYDIADPGPNDVLFGRGTGSNMHSGNIRFRALIQKYKPVYRDTPKKMKPSVSTKVVAIWRSQSPPGRFLTRSDRFHGSKRTFYDVGDAMARRKAAQCLREKSSKERLQIQQQKQQQQQEQQEAGGAGADGAEEQPDDDDACEGFPELDNAPGTITTEAGASSSSLEPLVDEDKAIAKSAAEDMQQDDMDLDHIDVLSVVTSANLREKFGPSSSSSSDPLLNEPPKEEKISDSMASSKLVPNLKKKKKARSSTTSNNNSIIAKKQDTDVAAWLACGGSPNKSTTAADSISLVNTYESNLEEETREVSDSPFLFASFDFESQSSSSHRNNDEEGGGLCFPSLFGGGGESSSSNSLFGGGDDNNNNKVNKTTNNDCFLGGSSSSGGMAFPSLFGGSAAAPSFPFEEEATAAPSTPEPPLFFPSSLPDPSVKQETLQTIRDRMPTAASLTTMDW